MTSSVDLPDWVQSVGGGTTLLFSGFVSNVQANPMTVAAYGSLQVLLLNLNNTDTLTVEYLFFDSASGQFVETGLLSADTNHSVAGDGWPVWELPVRADTFYLINGTAGAPLARVIGRPETRRKGMANAYYPVRGFTAVIPASTAANTRIQAFGVDGNNPTPVIQDCSNYNGAVTGFLSATQAITGQYQIGYQSKGGVRTFRGVFNNPGTAATLLQFGHPFGYITWWFQCLAISPASSTNVSITLFPSEVDG